MDSLPFTQKKMVQMDLPSASTHPRDRQTLTNRYGRQIIIIIIYWRFIAQLTVQGHLSAFH